MKKRILFTAIAFLLAVNAFAQSEADFQVTLTEDGTGAVITGYTGSAVRINIPATIQGMPVKEIGGRAFNEKERITSVAIPNGVIKISNGAFRRCSALTTVTIPESVTAIGNGAFSGTGLTSVTLRAGVTYGSAIDDNYAYYDGYYSIGVFISCPNLREVTIQEGVTNIPVEIFAFCRSLTTIRLPDSITEIGDNAFYNCSALRTITFPNSLIKIGRCAFRKCSALTSVTFSNSLTEIGTCAFEECVALTTLNLPASIERIFNLAFRDCRALTTVTIPESIISINFGQGSFYGTNLNLASQAALRRVGYSF